MPDVPLRMMYPPAHMTMTMMPVPINSLAGWAADWRMVMRITALR